MREPNDSVSHFKCGSNIYEGLKIFENGGFLKKK